MKKQLKFLIAIFALITLAGEAIAPVYAVFVEKIGGDLLTAGYGYAFFGIAAGILIFIISRWEDHVKHQEKLVSLGFAIQTAGFIGYVFVANPIHLFIVQVVLGLGHAITWPAFDGVYSRNLEKGRFASEWGLVEGMEYILIGVAGIIAGFIAQMFGFSTLFIVISTFGFLGFLISLNMLRKNAGDGI